MKVSVLSIPLIFCNSSWSTDAELIYVFADDFGKHAVVAGGIVET